MGFSLKKAVKSIASVAVPAAIGYATGGAGGAAAASLGGNSLLSGAVGLGTDMLQSQYNLSQQKELAKYNAEQQMAINNQVYQQNLAMWNAENEYNSPAAQMARYKAAGLNPNLIYGQSNTAGSAPQLQAAHFDAGSYHPVDKSSQRQQAAIALMEFNQRIKSQALDNELKREQLLLQAQASERQDKLANAQVYALMQNAGYTGAKINDLLYNPPVHSAPDRRGIIAKAVDDLKGLYNVAENWAYNHTTPDSRAHSWASAYKNSWFHRNFGAGR